MRLYIGVSRSAVSTSVSYSPGGYKNLPLSDTSDSTGSGSLMFVEENLAEATP